MGQVLGWFVRRVAGSRCHESGIDYEPVFIDVRPKESASKGGSGKLNIAEAMVQSIERRFPFAAATCSRARLKNSISRS